MTKNILLGLTSLGTLIAIGFLVSSSSLAAENGNITRFNRGNSDPANFEILRAEMEQRHEAIETALKNGDYAAWAALQPENSPIAEAITEEEFPRLIEAYRLMEESRAIMEELGLPGRYNSKGFGMMGFRHGLGGPAWNGDN